VTLEGPFVSYIPSSLYHCLLVASTYFQPAITCQPSKFPPSKVPGASMQSILYIIPQRSAPQRYVHEGHRVQLGSRIARSRWSCLQPLPECIHCFPAAYSIGASVHFVVPVHAMLRPHLPGHYLIRILEISTAALDWKTMSGMAAICNVAIQNAYADRNAYDCEN